MVLFTHLKKRRISQRGAGTKYYINCSYYSENADSIQTNTLIRNTNHVAILKSIITDDIIPKKNKHIVVKIMRSNKSSDHEFQIGQQLYENKLIGFIQYICLFSCYDTTNENNIEISAREPVAKIDTKICQGEHNEKNLKKVLVMPYIQSGSVEDFSWNVGNVHILKNLLIQAVLALYVAYDAIGFLHGDLHLGNILCKETKRRTLVYKSQNVGVGFTAPLVTYKPRSSVDVTDLRSVKSTDDEITIKTEGYKVVIMDFEKSETRVEKNELSNVSFWNNIYMMLQRVNTLSPNHGVRLQWENDEIIQFVKEARKRKYPCEREHVIKLQEMMNKSVFDFFEVREYKYDPDDV